jgi:hypothetical protein
MARQMAKICATAAAIGLSLAVSFGTSTTSEAFGRGGGGGHFGGGHFGGGHFGGGHFGGGYFGARHFGGTHFGAARFGGARFGARNFGARSAFGNHRMIGNLAGPHGAFHHSGFARNGFGGRHAWNAWNRGYGGYGWNGYGWDEWAGPVFWPYFYGDLLSFALWPYDFYDPFFGYGPDDLLSAIFWGSSYFGADYASEGNPYDVYGTARQVRTASTEFQAEADAPCSALAPGIADVPVDRVEKAIEPNDTQTSILNDLKTASAKADDILKASCPGETPLTPVSRIEAVGKRIDAMIQSVQIMRAPLTTLDNSLDDEQRARFNAITLGERSRRRSAEATTEASGLGDLCTQQANDFANLPVDQIEQTVKPSGQEQTAAFNALKDASAKAASSMELSCPTTVPQTLTDRFDAITKRLDAMAGAVKTIEPALKTFYASLSDEQKARFNVMPPPNGTQTTQRG